MPPKAKLHKDKGKLKAIPKPVLPSTVETTDPQPSSSSSSESQFEVELVWCIQQLQAVLAGGKLNEKQTHENSKMLNNLMNNSTPVIKKRQIMRLAFGDYRAKMAIEEQKYSKINRKIVLTQGKPSNKSVFVKKAPFLNSDKNFKFNFKQPELQSAESIQETSDTIEKLNLNEEMVEEVTKGQFVFPKKDFKFNFGQLEAENSMEKLNLSDQTIDQPKNNIEKVESSETSSNNFHFMRSNNVFRFNFNE